MSIKVRFFLGKFLVAGLLGFASCARSPEQLAADRLAEVPIPRSMHDDPDEKANFVEHRSPLTNELHDLATQYWQPNSAPITTDSASQVELDPATRERLRALGYIE